jgi:hypothetical protein
MASIALRRVEKTYGFGPKDMDRRIYIDNVLGLGYATPRQMLDILRRTYCGTFAVEFMHISDPDEKSWLQQRIEGIKSDELEPPSMVLTVPQGSATLSRLFALLSELRSTHHVLECSVTQCTLEQIFIQMASKSKLRKDDE